MRGWWIVFAAGLFIVVAAPRAPSRAAAPASPTAVPGSPEIEWKTSWDTTFVANRDRWRKELQPLADEPLRANQEYAQRLLKLAHALVEKYPDGGEAPERNYRLVGDEVAAITVEGHTAAYLRQFVAEFPGQVSLVAAALEAVMTKAELGWVRVEPFSIELARYTSDRALALQEAHYVAEGMPLLEQARAARFASFVAEQRFWDAEKVIESAKAAGLMDPARRIQATLLYSSGRHEDALPLLQELVVENAGWWWAGMLDIAQHPDAAPDFPRDLGLEMKWGALQTRAGGADPETVQALLDDSAGGQGLLPSEDGCHAAVWILLDRLLAAQKPEVMAPLRETQQTQAVEPLSRARRGGDMQALVLACRRYPWSAAAHEALLATGEERLRRGASGMALRMFEDVLSHGPGNDARARAQAGEWMALAGAAQDAQTIQQAFDGVADDARYPWFGGLQPASAIEKQLLEMAKPAAGAKPLPLAEVVLQLVRLPAAAPWTGFDPRAIPEDVLRGRAWPLGELQVCGEGVLASNPSLLACFSGDLSKPRWWRLLNETARRRTEGGASTVSAPGRLRPAVVGNHIYSRWGLDPSGQGPRGLASFDARTGQLEWSTDDDPSWGERWPINDPAEFEGRLYVLTIQDKVGAILPVYLACLDADSGRFLWERALGSQNPSLRVTQYIPAACFPEVVRYGNAVTVSRGAVYCSTNLGFVARCDARDGLVEWVATYPRTRIGLNYPTYMRRDGAAPVISGDRVIFVPRDCAGAFALDSRTGKPAWDVPLVPGEDGVGLPGGGVLLAGDAHLTALDGGSGRVLWDRLFPERPTGSPMVSDSAVLVCAGRKLVRLDLGTGAVLEEKALGPGERPSGCVLQGKTLVGLSQMATSPEPLVPPPAPAATSVTPLKVSWEADRPRSRLWIPPPEARMSDRAMLVSRGKVECIETVTGGVAWRRFLPPAMTGEPLWAEGTMILAGERWLTAIDGRTGSVRWECELPFRLGARRVCGPLLAVARRSTDWPQEQVLAAIDTATGRTVWMRALRQPKRVADIDEIGWDGKDFHCIGNTADPGGAKGIEFVVRGTDGETLAVRPFPAGADTEQPAAVAGNRPGGRRPARARGEPRRQTIVLGDGFGFLLTENHDLWEFTLADGKAVRRDVDLPAPAPNGGPALTMKLTGPWLQIQGRLASPTEAAPYANINPPTGRQWVLRRGDPGYVLALDYLGEIVGDTLYVPTNRSLRAIDLASRKETVYRVPVAADLHDGSLHVVDFCLAKDHVLVARSNLRALQSGPAPLRLEVFDVATGEWIDRQCVPGVYPDAGWLARHEPRDDDADRPQHTAPQLVCTDNVVLALDPYGLHVLGAAAPGEDIGGLSELVLAAPRPVAVDGSLDEWDESGGIALKGADGREGRLLLAHDAEALYLALRYPSPVLVPHVGSGDAAGGDWIEVDLAAYNQTRSFTLGADAKGRPACEALSGAPMPKAVRGAVRYDLARHEVVYETAIALKQLFQGGSDFRRMNLLVTAWDEKPGAGPVRLFSWGDGVPGRSYAHDGSRDLVLQPLTPKAAQALETIADELPDLPESFDYLLGAACKRADAAEARLALLADVIQHHPRNMTVDRLLACEQAVRSEYPKDAGKAILEIATKAGVPQPILSRYAVESQAYLSQWVYVPSSKQYPESITLEVDDGTSRGQAAWEHHVNWVRPYWPETDRPGNFTWQLHEWLPCDEWRELRVPLSILKLNNVPVAGLRFSQWHEPRVVWDRTAIVYGGKEEVVLDGALPGGATAGGTWEWLDKPTRTGRKTHACGAEPQPTEFHVHYAADFRAPTTAHVSPPPDGAYLSQWVYVDPKDPPRSLSLALGDPQGWRCHAIWGARSRHGRAMGPLPPAGSWQELRLPFAWTAVADKPFEGISFGQDGGQVYWDRTAVVSRGKETVLVDGETLPLARNAPLTWQPWADFVRGRALPHQQHGKVGEALACDATYGNAEFPHSPALEPEEMTVEAWVIFADPSAPRRWLVAKNGTEETDGHFALLQEGLSLGACLNIGGGKSNGFEAFSPAGALEPNQWLHCAMTYDGRDLNVYLGGKRVARTPVNRKRTRGTGILALGERPDGKVCFAGVIDEVRLYNRALSAEEIKARADADGRGPAGEAAKAVAGYWGFDDDVVPPAPAAGWQWVQQPSRVGKRAHTQTPKDRWAGHTAFFAKPVLAHLPFDPAAVTATLRRCLPDLGPTDDAWRLFNRMLEIDPDPNRGIELCQWFSKALPTHPHLVDTLCLLSDRYKELHAGEEGFSPEPFVRALNLAPAVFYRYNRQYLRQRPNFINAWLAIGPFPNPQGKGHDTAYPPETEPVRLDAEYDGIDGKVRWQSPRMDNTSQALGAIFGPKPKPGEPEVPRHDPRLQRVAYLASWVYSDKAQKVMVELGRDDSCKMWINRKLAYEGTGVSQVVPGQYKVPVDLAVGWNEVLLKVGNLGGPWGFALELVEIEGHGLPQGIAISTTPQWPNAGGETSGDGR